MPARVTQGMMNTQLLRNLNRNMLRNDHLQNQLSTTRRINKPSDDPVGITYGLRYRSELSANDQYQRNVDSAVSWLDYSDTMLNQAGDVLHRARELAVNGANSSNPQSALDSINSEVKELYSQLVSIGNSKFNGKYVFNGQQTETMPYSTAAVDDADPTKIKAMSNQTDSGKAADILFDVGAGVRVPVNVTGDAAFGAKDAPDNAFQILSDMSNALAAGDSNKVGALLDRFDQRMDQMLQVRSELGARTNRVQLVESRLKDISTNLQSLQAKTEDADMAEVITNLKMGENVYQASLSVGAKLISPSLIDFLR